MRNWVIFLALYLGACVAFTVGGSEHQCKIQLQANWNTTSFALQLIETIALHDETLYGPMLRQILADNDDIELGSLSDSQLYEKLISFVPSEFDRRVVDLQLANKLYTPRIQSHYKYFQDQIWPKFGAKVTAQCGSEGQAWATLDGSIYCDADDLFAIRSVTKLFKMDSWLPFDRVITVNPHAPKIVIYGDFQDARFQRLFNTLLQFVDQQQYAIVWRYVPPVEAVPKKERLAGYGVDLTLKRTDYIAVDDRFQKRDLVQDQLHVGDADSSDSTIFQYHDYIEKVYDIQRLDLQFTQFVLDRAREGYSVVKKVLLDLPKYASYLSSYPVTDESRIVEAASGVFAAPGLYINGRSIADQDLDVSHVVSALKQEFQLLKQLQTVLATDTEGLNKVFRLLSLDPADETTQTAGVKSPQRYDIHTQSRGIVYFNDIERDPLYRELSKSRKPYLNPQMRPGLIPQVRENVHSLVFAVQLSEPAQLMLLLQFAGFILQRKFPIQVGLVPLIKTEADHELARTFLYLSHTRSLSAGYNFLQDLAERYEAGDVVDMSDAGIIPEEDLAKLEKLLKFNRKFAETFDIKTPVAILNGVFIDLRFQDLGRVSFSQFVGDIHEIHLALASGGLEDGAKLRDVLFSRALPKRNTLIAPDDDALSPPDYGITTSFGEEFQSDCSDVPMVLSIVGAASKIVNYVKEASSLQETCVKVRVVRTDEVELDEEVTLGIDSVIYASPEQVAEHFSLSYLNPDEVLVVLNGRVLHLSPETHFKTADFQFLVEYERESRLSKQFNTLQELGFTVPPSQNPWTWFEQVSSSLSLTFDSSFDDFTSIHVNLQLGRLCTWCLDKDLTFKFNDGGASLVDVVAIVEPTKESSQIIVAMLDLFEAFPPQDVSVSIALLPSPEIKELGINMLYRGVFPNKVQFDNKGSLVDDAFALFDKVPEKTLFTFDVHTPGAWVVGIEEGDTDLDNVKLADTGDVLGVYQLNYLLVEGHLRVRDRASQGGIPVQLRLVGSQTPYSDTIVMQTLDYLQLKANPGVWELEVKPGTEAAHKYAVDSVCKTFVVNDAALSSCGDEYITVMDLSGVTVFPMLKEISPEESPNGVLAVFDKFSNFWKPKEPEPQPQADINIFSVASGHLYERFLGIMTASVRAHTNQTVKFWLIDNYMSPTFKKNLPKLAAQYDFSYELITYNWPRWLRPQREKQRTIWGYKILFLDVLFPQDLQKVIFVDADQIVRTDLKELVDLDLQGAPYGYTPMCDSREEMEGFRFWKQGYWDRKLGQNGMKYHISALYVIDLVKFRELMAGDALRYHYQQLSKDPGSLSNLDQDLPNNLQDQIKIFSLPQDWLWCETWCSDEALKTAKTIDLCNNPLTKEPKLARARRQIPEWTKYDDEINALLSGEKVEPKVETKVLESRPEDDLRDEL